MKPWGKCTECGNEKYMKASTNCPSCGADIPLFEEATMKMRHRKMIFNGNELVFDDAPNRGIVGLAPDMPDELAEMIAERWNDAEPCDGCHEAPADCPGSKDCRL